MTIGSPLLALIAGVLSILSPCVLPILPVVLGAAASEHRYGPLALAAGLSLSFVVLGLFLATAGHSIGLDAERLRSVAAASGTIGLGKRPGRELGRQSIRPLSEEHFLRAILDRSTAGRRLEPVCRSDAGSGLAVGSAGARRSASRVDDVRFWRGGGAPAAGIGMGLA